MDKTFNSDQFIKRIGERLVNEFRDARSGTTPSTVGSAMEQPVRKQLEQILPRGIGVGQGFVIDSYGKTSQQQDVIIYERDICPVFSVNDTPETTYYPCEGVIAIGEVKSILDRGTLNDAFKKIQSVKALQRYDVPQFMPHPTTGETIPARRSYLAPHGDSIVDVNESKEKKERAQIFGFILAGETKNTAETLRTNFVEFSSQIDDSQLPNLLVILEGYYLRWGKIDREQRREVKKMDGGKYGVSIYNDGKESWQNQTSVETASHIGWSEISDPFRTLVRWIKNVVKDGRTSDVSAFDRYFMEKDGETVRVHAVPRN